MLSVRGIITAGLIGAALVLGGCKTGAIGSVDAGPFMFATTGVPNGCFVESVRFHDEFHSNSRSRDGWLRVLQWGNREDFTRTRGHAVAVFEWRGKLAVFDINGGVRPLAIDSSEKTNIREVAEPLFARYPQYEATGEEFLIDVHRRQKPGIHIPRDFPNAPKYHPLLRAAKSIARHREVRVLRFAYTEGAEEVESAAFAFVFDGRLCIYTREKGTMVGTTWFADISNDRGIRERLERAFKDKAPVKFIGG